MYDVIGSLLPLGLAISFSPFPMIAIVLLLLTPRPRANGAAFLTGWFLAILVATIAFTAVAKVVEQPDPSDPNAVAGVLRLLLGLSLLVLAVRKFIGGPKQDAEGAPVLPDWISMMTSSTPGRSFTTGLLLAGANPKNLAFTAAAALSIGTGGLDASGIVWTIVLYVIVAAITIILPLLCHLAFSARLMGPLEAMERWLLANHTTVMAMLLVVFGVVLIGNGVASF